VKARSQAGRYNLRFGAIAVLAAALTASAAAVASPADASSASLASPCVHQASRHAAPADRLPDTSPVSKQRMRTVERLVAAAPTAAGREAGTSSSARAADLPTFRVKVQVHVIHGRHRREHKVKRRDARRLFHILQDGYNGAQWPGVSEPMGVSFRLKRITVSRNDRWYHAAPMSRGDKQMRNRLHRGTASTLNIYVKKLPSSGGSILLGHSRFPWQYRHLNMFDGVEVNVDAMPGGRARGYNLGDTVIHESGHWFGLLHPFEGDACNPTNDQVADTPAESRPASSCEDASNVCDPTQLLPAPGGPGYYNPALNFMDYSPDPCMRMFTRGQHERFVPIYQRYRAGR
jgi:hypothetical protein